MGQGSLTYMSLCRCTEIKNGCHIQMQRLFNEVKFQRSDEARVTGILDGDSILRILKELKTNGRISQNVVNLSNE